MATKLGTPHGASLSAGTRPSSKETTPLLTNSSDASSTNVLFSPLIPIAEVDSSAKLVADALPTARHWSVFYPDGIEVLQPITLHYLHLGCWCTVAGGWDYFSQRNLRKGEVMGHRVEWLHTALPRDRFVFMIFPVEARRENSLWSMFSVWKALYGQPPAFAFARGKLLWRVLDGSRKSQFRPKRPSPTETAATSSGEPLSIPGVEVIEIRHADITAMDYAPGITSSRLALETRVASALWFRCAEDAYVYYGCTDKIPQADIGSSGHFASHTRPRPEPSLVACTVAGAASQSSHAVGLEGGEAADSQSLLAESRQISQLEPLSPLPSPDASSTVPTRECDEPEILVLPPSSGYTPTVAASDSPTFSGTFSRQAMLATASSRYLDASALNAVESPNVSPSLPPQRKASAADPETRKAEHAAAELLHAVRAESPSVGPRETTRHYNTMVTVYAQDPHFNAVLREVLMPEPGTFPFTASLQEQRRLLGLYETGMPSWTIFVTRYGLPYRRWFRLTAVMLVNIWPLIALCVGLYDLYKHMPYLKEFLSDTLTPFTTWMDHHFTLRVSMLITYLVTVSTSVLFALHSFVKSAIALFNFILAPLLPLLQLFTLLAYPLRILWSAVMLFFGPIWTLLWLFFTSIQTILLGPFKAVYLVVHTFFAAIAPGAPAASAAVHQASYFMLWWRSWLDFWDKVARPIKNVAKAMYDGVVHVGVSLVRREASIRRWYTAKLRLFTMVVELYVECLHMNWLLFVALPSWKCFLVAAVVLAVSIASVVTTEYLFCT